MDETMTDQQPRPTGPHGDRPRVTMYFDFMSPYAYLAQHHLRALARQHDWAIDYRAIDLGPVKAAVGNTGPANRDMPVKLAYLKTDLQRWADLYGVPFAFPPNLRAARLNEGFYFPECAGAEAAYVQEVFENLWGRGAAPDDASLLRTITDRMGWAHDRFVAFLDKGAGSAPLASATEIAIGRQIFGVPTFEVGEERWWGNDRLFMLERHLTRK